MTSPLEVDFTLVKSFISYTWTRDLISLANLAYTATSSKSNKIFFSLVKNPKYSWCWAMCLCKCVNVNSDEQFLPYEASQCHQCINVSVKLYCEAPVEVKHNKCWRIHNWGKERSGWWMGQNLSYCCVFHHTASVSLLMQSPLPIRPGWSLLPGLSAALQFQSSQATSVHSLTDRLFYTPMSDFTALFVRQNSWYWLIPTTTSPHLHFSKHYCLLSLTIIFACKLCSSHQNFQTFRTFMIHETYKTFLFLQTCLTHIVQFHQLFAVTATGAGSYVQVAMSASWSSVSSSSMVNSLSVYLHSCPVTGLQSGCLAAFANQLQTLPTHASHSSGLLLPVTTPKSQ